MAANPEREAAVEAFAAVATPDEKAKVAVVEDSVNSAVTAALAIEVATQAEAEAATDVLGRIAGELKRAEEARKFLVGPLNAHVKAINERFRGPREALEQADQIIREKVIGFRREQERRRQQEEARLRAEQEAQRARLEQERRRAEAEARAAREAAAREAARREAEARQAERRRREELERQASERRREIAQMDEDALRLLDAEGDHCGSPADARMAREELAARRRAREAQEAAAAARRREEEARALEQERQRAPLPDVPEASVERAPRLAATSGTASERKRWVATVEQSGLVPRQYLMVDQAAINRAVRQGVRAIPGVRIEQVDELAVKAR